MESDFFLTLGIVCVIAAVVGGGLKLLGIEIPPINSLPRQLALGAMGIVLIVVGIDNGIVGPPACDDIVYTDVQPQRSSHGIELVSLTAKSCNPPKVGDPVSVELTLRNGTDQPVPVLAVWVTAYDPNGANKDFAYLRVNRSLTPQELVTTSGERVLDVAGTWELGPHYALGKTWNGERYPGHWKRFPITVRAAAE